MGITLWLVQDGRRHAVLTDSRHTLKNWYKTYKKKTKQFPIGKMPYAIRRSGRSRNYQQHFEKKKSNQKNSSSLKTNGHSRTQCTHNVRHKKSLFNQENQIQRVRQQKIWRFIILFYWILFGSKVFERIDVWNVVVRVVGNEVPERQSQVIDIHIISAAQFSVHVVSEHIFNSQGKRRRNAQSRPEQKKKKKKKMKKYK